MLAKLNRDNINIWLIITIILASLFWSGVLRKDGTPYGDGSRIAPFIKMFDNHSSFFPMWGPRNGGEPILANPEHFYLLGYLLDWSKNYNFLFNLVLFLFLIFVGVSGFMLARALKVNSVLSCFYALTLLCNGYVILIERSARLQAISIIVCTLLVNCFIINKSKYSKYFIPILIAISIYNGIHYSAITIISFFIFSVLYEDNNRLLSSLNLILRGVILSLPFLLPAFLHPIFNGWHNLEGLKYNISTVNLTEFLFPIVSIASKEFLGFQIYLILPIVIASFVYKVKLPYWLLVPILPWLSFVLAHYFPDIETVIENSIISNWRHNGVFYQAFLIFGFLFIVKSIAGFSDKIKTVFSALFIILTILTMVSLYGDARSEHRASDNKRLHVSNKDHLAHRILKNNDILEASKHYRIFSAEDGIYLPESRVYSSFSYFNSNGFATLATQIDGSIIKSRPHWSKVPSPCDGVAVKEFAYAGYSYLFCKRKNLNRDKILLSNGYKLIDSRGVMHLYEKNIKHTFGVTCNEHSGVREAVDENCERHVIGNVSYEGNSIHANFRVEDTSVIFFHENFALGWFGIVNGGFYLPNKINDIFIGYKLEEGDYTIDMYYVDPFFVLGLIAILIYMLINILIKKYCIKY